MTGHIFINGEIGETTTPLSVRSQISHEYSNYEVHINSFGGDVYDGYQIGNMILNLGKPTLAIVEGMCASIATYIACCADKVSMIPQGLWIIHDPTATTGGRAEDLLKAAAQLNDIKARIVARYMTKVGKNGISQQQLSDAMAVETAYDSDQAKKWGFIDDVQEKLRAVAKIDLKKFNKMETLSKEETLGLFEKFGQKLDSFINSMKPKETKKPAAKPKAIIKPKNIELTLTDGTVLNVDAEDPNNLVGASVSSQDGTPLADGTYETVDGLELEVESNMITEAEQQPVNESDDNPSEDTDPNIKNEDGDMETYDKLMAELGEIKKKIEKVKPGAQPATATTAAKAKATKTEFKDNPTDNVKNTIEELEKQVAELKKMTVGKQTPPAAKPIEQDDEEEVDESFATFSNHLTQFLEGRNFIKRTN